MYDPYPNDLHKSFLEVVTKNKKNFLEQGKLLWNLRKNSIYRIAIGDGGVDSWHEYLSQPEIGMSPTQANKLLNIYDLFIKRLEFSEEEIIKIPIKTLNYLAKRKEEIERLGKEKQEEIIAQAQVLHFKDFKEAYFDQLQVSEELGQSESGRTFSYILMKKCDQTGNMTKIHDPEEHLGDLWGKLLDCFNY